MEETFVFGKEELSCCWYRLPKINTYAFIFLASVVTHIYILPPLKRWMIEFTFTVVRSCPRPGFWTSSTFFILVHYDMMVIWVANMYVCYSEPMRNMHIIVECIFEKLVTIYRNYIFVKTRDESLWDLKRVVVFINKIKSR